MNVLENVRSRILLDREEEFRPKLQAARRALEGRFGEPMGDEEVLRLAVEHQHLSDLWDLLLSLRPLASAANLWKQGAWAAVLVVGWVLSLALPAVAQDAVELRTANGVGNQVTRLSISSGTTPEVKLFATFNAQGNAVTNVSSLSVSSLSSSSLSLSGPLTSTVATGTAPFTIASTTLVANLNADLLDGFDSTAFMAAGADNWVNVTGDSMSGPLVLEDQAEIRLGEASANGTNYTGFRAPADLPIGSNSIYVLPSAYPATDGQVLSSTAAGVLGWSTPAGGTVTSVTAGSGLVPGTITTSGTIAIAEGGVTSFHIQDASISLADVAPNGATDGQVIKWVGGQWVPAPDATSGGSGAVMTIDSIAPDGAGNFGIIGSSSVTVSTGPNSVALTVPAGGISSGHIADNTILFADVAQNGALAGQVMKWNGTAWAAAPDVDTDTNSGGTVTSVSGTGGLTGTVTSSGSLSVATGGVTSAMIADGTISNADISTTAAIAFSKLSGVAAASHTHLAADLPATTSYLGSAIESTEIADGTIAFADMAQNAASTGQVMKWNGTAWAAAPDVDTDTNSGGTVTSVSGTGGLTGTVTSSGSLSIASGGVTSTQIADTTKYVSIQNSAATEQFAVTDGTPALQFLGSGATSVAFDAVNRRVTISSTDANSGGTVTSVGLSMPGQFIVSGTPVAGSGTLTAAWANQTANTVLAAPNGVAGTPTFRALAAADLPVHSHSGADLTSGTVSDARLSSNVALLNTTQTFAAPKTFSAAGTALAVTNDASVGGKLQVGSQLGVGSLPGVGFRIDTASGEAYGVRGNGWAAGGVFVDTDSAMSAQVATGTYGLYTDGVVRGSSLVATTTTGAPLTVSSTAKVSSLNADLLDGLDSGAFANASHTHLAADLPATTSYLGTTIESAEITDGTITNTDISTAAAIAFSKLSGVAAASHTHLAADLPATTSYLGSTIESVEITDGTIANADISSAAAISATKIAEVWVNAAGDSMTGALTLSTTTMTGISSTSTASGGTGVAGVCSTGTGVSGNGSAYGVFGQTTSGKGVYGTATTGQAGYFNGNVQVTGSFTAASKSFVQPHPNDPALEVQYVCFEGAESGIFTRGTATLSAGEAVVDLPEHFRIVASPGSASVLLTPKGPTPGLYVADESPERIVVREMPGGSGAVEFNYLVVATRRHFEDCEPVQPNTHFRPDRAMSREEFLRIFGEGTTGGRAMRALAMENGILHPDGTLNETVIQRLGWEFAPPATAPDLSVVPSAGSR